MLARIFRRKITKDCERSCTRDRRKIEGFPIIHSSYAFFNHATCAIVPLFSLSSVRPSFIARPGKMSFLCVHSPPRPSHRIPAKLLSTKIRDERTRWRRDPLDGDKTQERRRGRPLARGEWFDLAKRRIGTGRGRGLEKLVVVLRDNVSVLIGVLVEKSSVE